MTVAVNSSIGGFGALSAERDNDFAPERLEPKESFDNHFKNESAPKRSDDPAHEKTNLSSQKETTSDTEDIGATTLGAGTETDLQKSNKSGSAFLSLGGASEGEIKFQNELREHQNHAGSIDPSQLAEQSDIRAQNLRPQGETLGNAVASIDRLNPDTSVQNIRLSDTDQNIPLDSDISARITLPAGGEPNVETAEQIKLNSDEPSLRDIKTRVGDHVSGRIPDSVKEAIPRTDAIQGHAALSAENYIKTAIAAPAAINIDPTSASPDINSLGLNSVSSQPESAQRAAGVQTLVNAQAQTSAPPPALQIVSDNLIKALVSQSGVIMRLDPPEMGNVQINFQFDSERAVTAVIRSELADTSSFLRERAEHLQQALKDSGFDTINLSFEQGSQSNQDEYVSRDTYKETRISLDDDVASKAANINLTTRRSNVIVGDQPVDIKL